MVIVKVWISDLFLLSFGLLAIHLILVFSLIPPHGFLDLHSGLFHLAQLVLFLGKFSHMLWKYILFSILS